MKHSQHAESNTHLSAYSHLVIPTNATMTKDCGHHNEERQKLLRRVFAAVLGFIFLILLVIFLIWIILRPTKPRFILQDATVYAFNLSSSGAIPSPTAPTPNTLTLTMQVTLSAFNPNHRIGVYYTKLDAYASYRGQQVSLATALPPTYQGHRDTAVWSPFLYGTAVPVSPFMLQILQQDKTSGGVLVNVKVNGRVKWKVGTWVSGRYHINVNCPAYIRLAGDDDDAIGVAAPAVKFQLFQSCIVDV
ncbi:NDR1/HIN1-like protein 1 [Vigna unguiculata]|nr:NDR1/HIN1-like protein 1 [Vigna unguiculata]